MNKKLLSSVREYKKESVLAPILVILEVLMEVLIPLEMAKIIDVGIANGDMGYIIQRGHSCCYGDACSVLRCTGRKHGCSCGSRICEEFTTRYFLQGAGFFFQKYRPLFNIRSGYATDY